MADRVSNGEPLKVETVAAKGFFNAEAGVTVPVELAKAEASHAVTSSNAQAARTVEAAKAEPTLAVEPLKIDLAVITSELPPPPAEPGS
jgi:hypothetical protein